MRKRKIITIIIVAFVLFYIFLIFSPSLFIIPAFVFTDKSEYSIGESVTVTGFSIQPHGYTSSCYSLLRIVYDSDNLPLSVNSSDCFLPVGYTLPMVFFSDVWDQKILVGVGVYPTEERDLVEPGKYSLYYMKQKVPINIKGNSDQNKSDAIISSVVVPSKNFVPIELELNKNSRISFFFSYDENIIINKIDKTRKPTYELLHIQLFDPNHKLLVNFTGDVATRDSSISKSFSFVSELTGNYSAVITNPQDNSVSVHYSFGGVEKLERLMSAMRSE